MPCSKWAQKWPAGTQRTCTMGPKVARWQTTGKPRVSVFMYWKDLPVRNVIASPLRGSASRFARGGSFQYMNTEKRG